MKKLLLIVCLIPSLTFAQSKKQRKAQAKADKETLDNIQKHVQYLADDKLEGRRAGSPGELLAAQYISQQFAQAGLEAKGSNGFMQEFAIREGKQAPADQNHFTVNGRQMELQQDYYPLAFSASTQVSGSCSPGLREKDLPWFWDVADLLDDNKNNPHFDIDAAIAIEANRTSQKKGKALIIFNSSSAEDNIHFNKRDSSAIAPIPVVYLTKAGQKKYFTDLTDYYQLNLQVSLTSKERKSRNVVAFIDNHAPTTVILGAHFDHLGRGEDGNSLDGQGEIHNGADDNASGTAALIELGRILKNAGAKHNNYLFIAFSGEELGLLGSKYWLENADAAITPNYMINMDMIGRYDSSRKLTIGGYGTSPVWPQVFSTVTDKNLLVKFDSSGAGPSDHASFYYKNIPVLFFFTNSHSDYHKASDDWNKINYNGELEIVKYIQHIVDATDNQGKLAFLPTRQQEIRSVRLPVTLGVMPDYGFSGTGMRIDGISKGKLAERIGLQPGDVLLQLGNFKFIDVQTYMQALGNFKKGDKTQLRIKRGNTEKTFPIEF